MVSDSCDDLWDCSSNEGGEILSDSDTSDDITSEVTKRDAQKKYELVSKAEKAFAEMLSRLNKKIPPKTLTPPIVCSKNTKKKGTCIVLLDIFTITIQTMHHMSVSLFV